MGDQDELQIKPEQTPGKAFIRNPFESPNDYHQLREPLVPSPSVFKSKPSRATPAKFNWSIEEMASLLPVDIDPEDIQRQSLYLSQTRIDSDIEEKRQNAIEQFFTKEAIVPSPWAVPASRKTVETSNKESPASPLIIEKSETLNVACQSTLSLPVDFDLERILGEYYRCEEVSEAVQESLSSSSLRRKLFLDGQSSSSEDSGPLSPERSSCSSRERSSPSGGGVVERPVGSGEFPEGKVVSSFLSSPLACGTTVSTPSTCQLSSSPIGQGHYREYSLGSISSPMLPDRSSPAAVTSPSFSPIGPRATLTPAGSDMEVNSCTESPYVEGCSPIRSCSPHQFHFHNLSHHHHGKSRPRTRTRCWTSPPQISPILNPKLRDGQAPGGLLASPAPAPALALNLPSMELDPASPSKPSLCLEGPEEGASPGCGEPGREEREEAKEYGVDRRLEDIMEAEEEAGGTPGQLTSSVVVNVSMAESSQMLVSLADGSSVRYDSSMQVDSGYNTTSAGTASLIDCLSWECHSKESFSSNLADEALPFPRNTKAKVLYLHQ